MFNFLRDPVYCLTESFNYNKDHKDRI